MLVLSIFALSIAGLLWHDLNRKDQVIPLGTATRWSLFYVAYAAMFACFLWIDRGAETAGLFVTAYVLEMALSVDNLMVFTAVFVYFGIPPMYQHRVLYWGILGAIVFRLIFVLIGASALEYIGWPVEVLFATLIGIAAWKVLLLSQDEPEEIDHKHRWYVRAVSKIWPVSPTLQGNWFCYRVDEMTAHKDVERTTYITPLFLCLVSIEMMDLMFAVDSVPVVIAVARDPLIIYSAMIFAILGLRSMYFVLSALSSMLTYLDKAVGIVLFFVAGKLFAGVFDYHIDPFVSLAVVVSILAGGVAASLAFKPTFPST